jgi:hypothetical protein
MAKPDKLTELQREIVRAQNDALLRLPANRDDRIKLIHGYRREKALENDKIAQAKKDVGSSETLKRLTGTYGLKKQAVSFINVLSEMAATDRSACLRQVINHGADEGWIIPDLFDEGAVGVGSADEAGETAGFDKTTEGKRQASAGVQQRSVEQMAESNAAAAPTPGLPLDEAEKQLEAYRAANPPKRGRKPAELVRLEAQVETAKAGTTEPPVEAAAEPEIAELPEAKPGEITAALKAGADESTAHIRDQVENGPTAPPVVEAAPEKAKRTRAPKKVVTPPAPPPVEAGPSAPPAVEDDEDDSFPEPGAPPVRPDAIGNMPATFRVG